jgi:pheromone shutdown protein TraB
MENPIETTGKPEKKSAKNVVFSWSVFIDRVLRAGFMLLIFGAVLILLVHLNVALPPIIFPWAVLGGGIAMLALTMLGVPMLPAAVVGVGCWLVLQSFAPGHSL